MMGRNDKTVNNLHTGNKAKKNYLYATSSSLKVLLHSVYQALQCTYKAAEFTAPSVCMHVLYLIML